MCFWSVLWYGTTTYHSPSFHHEVSKIIFGKAANQLDALFDGELLDQYAYGNMWQAKPVPFIAIIKSLEPSWDNIHTIQLCSIFTIPSPVQHHHHGLGMILPPLKLSQVVKMMLRLPTINHLNETITFYSCTVTGVSMTLYFDHHPL